MDTNQVNMKSRAIFLDDLTFEVMLSSKQHSAGHLQVQEIGYETHVFLQHGPVFDGSDLLVLKPTDWDQVVVLTRQLRDLTDKGRGGCI